MTRHVRALAILLFGAMVVACHGGHPPTHWYAAGPTWAAYLAWTEDTSGHLQGQVQFALIDQSNPTQLKSINAPFTGTLNGSDISISFPVLSSYGGETWTGTLQYDSLSLVIPTAGLPSSVTLHAGSFADFQLAANKLQQSVSRAQQQQASYDAAVAQRQSAYNDMARASDQMNAAYAATRKALANLHQMLPIMPARNSLRTQYADAWSKMLQDWAREQQAAQVLPMTCYKKGIVSYIAGIVAYDLGTITYVDGKSRTLLALIQSNVNDANDGVASLQTWAPIYDSRAQDYAQLTGAGSSTDSATSAASSFASSSNQALEEYAKRVAAFEHVMSSYDDRAAALNNRATSFPNSLHCSG